MQKNFKLIFFIELKFLFNQQFWKKKLFKDYCEFWKIGMNIHLTHDISETKRANDLKNFHITAPHLSEANRIIENV